MAKQQKHIDDLFKDHLGDAEFPLSGGEWDAVFAELHPKKKKRFLWWIWLFPALIAIGGITYWATRAPNTAQNASDIVKESTTPSDYNTNTQNDPKIGERENLKDVANPSTLKGSSNTDQQVKENQQNPINNSEAENLAVNNTTTTNNNISKSFTDNIYPTKFIVNNDATGDIKTENDNSSTGSILSARTALEHSLEYKTVSLAELKSIFYDKAYLGQIPAVTSLDPINVPALAGGDYKPTNIKVGLISGANLNRQSIYTSGSELDKYKKLRSANEVSGVGQDVSLLVKANVRSLTIGSGISYSSRRQTFNQDEFTYQLYDSIPVLNPQSDTIGFFRWNYRDTTEKNQIVTPAYNYVTIPIAIGKEFYFGNKWSLETTVNSNFGYLVSAKGNSLNSDAGLKTLNAGALNRLLVDVGIGLGANYKINDKWTANINGRLNRDLTDAIKSQDISQKMTTYGLGIGVYYSIKR